jgi:hypothetical protein
LVFDHGAKPGELRIHGFDGAVGAPVVNDDDLEVLEALSFEGPQTGG